METVEELEQRARDLETLRIVRGINAVNRAVDSAERRRAGIDPPTLFRVPGSVAAALSWPLCACGRGIEPGGAVTYRGELLHPECVVERLRGRLAPLVELAEVLTAAA